MTDLVLIFFVYSFAGFLLEVLYARLTRCPKRDRKCFLFLPLCPVYGIGAAAILAMPPALLPYPLLVFIAGGLLATLAEYATAFFYEVGAGVRFWDYAQQPGNLSGRICPLYTLYWGVLSLGLVYWFHPHLLPLLARVSPAVLGTLFLCAAADGLASLWLLHRTRSTDSLLWYRILPARKDVM